jgi:hypothetical protein
MAHKQTGILGKYLVPDSSSAVCKDLFFPMDLLLYLELVALSLEEVRVLQGEGQLQLCVQQTARGQRNLV